MTEWLEWARGPVFRACLIIMLLGLLRILALNLANIARLVLGAKKYRRQVPFGAIALTTLKWLFPFKKAAEHRFFFSATSIVFHIAIIVTPIFLGAHILLWKRGMGIGWPALSAAAADYLTLLAIAAGFAIVIERLASSAGRNLSRFQDYFLPLVILAPFVTGYLAMHPGINPFSYNGTMLVHVMSANLLLLAMPFSKLSHMILFPMAQLISELGWYLEPESGRKVMIALGKENESL